MDAEIERYIAEPVQIRSPLMWWKHYEQRFPSLATLARKILCVMGTSVPSERVFSTAGLTVTKRRANLSADAIDEIIFLNKALNSSSSESVTKGQIDIQVKKEPEPDDDVQLPTENENEDLPDLPCLY